jgi:hypothetical protein
VNVDASKRKRLKERGWVVGSAQDFLGLSDQESVQLDMRVALARLLTKRRHALGYTQARVAAILGSSQSRVAKMEAGHPTVSIDLMIRSLLVLGATRQQVGRAIAAPARRSA